MPCRATRRHYSRRAGTVKVSASTPLNPRGGGQRAKRRKLHPQSRSTGTTVHFGKRPFTDAGRSAARLERADDQTCDQDRPPRSGRNVRLGACGCSERALRTRLTPRLCPQCARLDWLEERNADVVKKGECAVVVGRQSRCVSRVALGYHQRHPLAGSSKEDAIGVAEEMPPGLAHALPGRASELVKGPTAVRMSVVCVPADSRPSRAPSLARRTRTQRPRGRSSSGRHPGR